MPDLTPWEYRSFRSDHRYELQESLIEGHPLSYLRRRRKGTTKWRDFKPFCKCGWKHAFWYDRKQKAADAHANHAYQFENNNPRLF